MHNFIPTPQATKIPDGKAALRKEWKKLETIPAWALSKVKSKKGVILEAQRDNIARTQNAEEQRQSRAPVSIVKDDSGANAVFTEQGSSASQIQNVIARLPGCDGQASDAVSAYSQVKLEDAPKLLEIPKSEKSRYLDTKTTTQMAKVMGES